MERKLIEIIKASNSWEEFKNACITEFSSMQSEPGLRIKRDPLPSELSDFTKNIKKGLNWNPKEQE